MLSISQPALREGCDRARDVFLLSRLQGFGGARETMAAVFEALGVDADLREELERAVPDLVPVEGAPALEATVRRRCRAASSSGCSSPTAPCRPTS